MVGGVPDNKGGADGDEVELDDLVVVGASVDVVDDVFEDESQVADRHRPGQRVDARRDDYYQEQKVDAAAVKASLQILEHVVAACGEGYINITSKTRNMPTFLRKKRLVNNRQT
jgi:hypothetical protein